MQVANCAVPLHRMCDTNARNIVQWISGLFLEFVSVEFVQFIAGISARVLFCRLLVIFAVCMHSAQLPASGCSPCAHMVTAKEKYSPHCVPLDMAGDLQHVKCSLSVDCPVS